MAAGAAGFRRLSLGLYAAAAGLSLTTLAVFVVHGSRQSDALAREVARSHDARIDARDVTPRLQAAAAAERDFLLTGRPAFLQTYARRREDVRLRQAGVERALTDDPMQRARGVRLSHLLGDEIDDLDHGVRARRDGGLAAAVRYAEGDHDAARWTAVQAAAADIDAAEIRRLDARQAARASLQRGMNVAGGLTAVMLLALVTVVLWRERREAARRAELAMTMQRERLRIDTLKAEFIATVSHELRTPLTAIVGALGLLKSGGGAPGDRAARLVHIAEANSTRLMRLIDDILDLEKGQSGAARLDLRVQSFNALAQRAAGLMAGSAERHSITLRVVAAPDDPRIDADADRILQVITNLISNAVTFSPPGAVVELRIDGDAQGVRAAVVDHGPGVPPAFASRLFERFAQADGSDARRHKGTGLGLAIARDIARRHGGDVTHAPTPGGGATFILTLPLADRREPRPSRMATVAFAQTGTMTGLKARAAVDE